MARGPTGLPGTGAVGDSAWLPGLRAHLRQRGLRTHSGSAGLGAPAPKWAICKGSWLAEVPFNCSSRLLPSADGRCSVDRQLRTSTCRNLLKLTTRLRPVRRRCDPGDTNDCPVASKGQKLLLRLVGLVADDDDPCTARNGAVPVAAIVHVSDGRSSRTAEAPSRACDGATVLCSSRPPIGGD